MTSPSNRLSLLGRSALRYAEHGWAVFPLRDRDKVPLLRGNWRELATVDPEQITEWWSANPSANIGLPTGITFDVLDVDGPEGLESLNALAPQYRHDGPVVLTGRGYHLFLLPTGHGNRANLAPKLDYRGAGGYVAAPPSIHPSGRTYQWDNDHHRGIAATLWHAPQFLADILGPVTPTHGLPRRVADASAAVRVPNREIVTGPVSLSDLPADQIPNSLRYRSQRPDILQVAVGLGLTPKKRSDYWVVRCIFGRHTDTTPSLTLYPHDNSFHCFGCGAHGDSFDLRAGKPME